MAYQSQTQTISLSQTTSKYKSTTPTLTDISNKLSNSRVNKIHTQSLKPLLSNQTVIQPSKQNVSKTSQNKTNKTNSTSISSTNRVMLSRPKPQSIDVLHSKIKVIKPSQPVQLHKYLIDQTPNITTCDSNEQTDRFLQEQLPQPYLPIKSGVDNTTQVDYDIIYNYDRDIELINNTIVNKVLEQCVVEVRQEAELFAIRLERTRLTQAHAAESIAIQTLEIQSNVRLQYKDQLIKHAQLKQAAQHQLYLKLQANRIAHEQTLLSSLNVLTQLHNNGYFIDHDAVCAKQHVQSSIDAIQSQLQQYATAQSLTDTTVQHSVHTLRTQQQQHHVTQQAELQLSEQVRLQAVQQIAEQHARNELIELYIVVQTNDVLQQSNIGPLYLTGTQSITDLQQSINTHITQLLNTTEQIFDVSRIELQLDRRPINTLNESLYDMKQTNTLQLLSVMIVPPIVPIEVEESTSDDEENEQQS